MYISLSLYIYIFINLFIPVIVHCTSYYSSAGEVTTHWKAPPKSDNPLEHTQFPSQGEDH